MLKFILLSVNGLYLYNDYKTDKGQHLKAKIINGVVIGLITYMYADSFQYFGWMLRKPNQVFEIWNTPVGIIPGEVYLIINILCVLSGIALVIFASKMTKRSKACRTWTLRVLPVITLTEIVSFYKGWMSEGDDSLIQHVLAFVIGTISLGGICTLIILAYTSEYMNNFFSRKNLDTVEIRV